jgi:8-amino-7-oxononanoate synthase
MVMKIIQSPSGGHMTVDGKEILNFGGTCYLGICDVPEIIDAAVDAVKSFGAMGQIPKHYGYMTQCHSDAEEAGREYFETEAAVYFIGGYLFAAMALQGLKDDYDVIFIDEKSHFSVRDGAMTTGKPIYEFKYCDAEDLKRVVEKNLNPGQIPMLAVDGMFPTYGNLSPLDEYYDIIKPYNGWMVVDESHSFGIIGSTGKGVVEACGIPRERVVAGGSMAKAFCAYGGLAVGSKHAIDKLMASGPAKGASSGMTSSAAMTAASLRYVKGHPGLLEQARKNIRHLKMELNALGLNVGSTESPVATFEFGKAEDMKEFQQSLEKEGIFVQYSTYVGAGPEGVIRLASYPDHTKEDIERLINAIKKYKKVS